MRPDGYHPLATVYQAVDLHDEVRATVRDDDRIAVAVHSEMDVVLRDRLIVPEDDDNLAVRAARAPAEVTGSRPRASIWRSARSSRSPAAWPAARPTQLRPWWPATTCGAPDCPGPSSSRSPPASGSDVPFLLHGGNASAAGEARLISPVLARGSYHWVFAMAHDGLSTKAVYAEFDRINERAGGPSRSCPTRCWPPCGLATPRPWVDSLSNDLTEAALSLRPELTGHPRDRHRGRCPRRDPVRIRSHRDVPRLGRAAQPRHRVRAQQRVGLCRRRPVPRARRRRPHHLSQVRRRRAR